MKINSVKEFISNRKILFFLFGTFFFLMNISISYSVVPVYLISQNFSLAQIGISTTIYSLFTIFLRIFLGPLADRKGRKFSLLISSFSFIISWIFIWLAPNYEVHLIARLVQAVGPAMFMSSASSVVSDLADSKILGSCMGIYRGFMSMGVILGPVYALTMSNFGFNVMFIGTISISLISFLLLTFISETKVDFGKNLDIKRTGMFKDYMVLLRNPRLLRFYLAVMTATIGFGIVNTNSAVFLNSLDNVLKPGTFLFFFGVFGMIASMIGGRFIDKRGVKNIIIPGAFLALTGFIGMAFVGSFGNLALIVVIIALGLGTNSIVISSVTSIGRETGNDLKATSYAIMDCAYDSGFAVGNMLFGFMVTSFGYSYGFLIIAFILALSYLGIFTGEYVRKRKLTDNE